MISTKSTLAMECEQHNTNILNEAVVPRVSAANRVEQIRLFSPPPSTGYDVHRSINHLAKEISESATTISSSDNSREFLSLGVPSDLTTGSVSNTDNIQSHDHASCIGGVKYYDEGTYLYTSDEIAIEHNACRSISNATSTTVIGTEIAQSYATAQSYVRAENYLDAIRFFEISLALVKKQQAKNHSSSIAIPLMEHYIYHNMGNCYFCRNQNDVAMTFYQMALQVAIITKFDSPIHIAAAQNAIAVLHLQNHEQQQQYQISCSNNDAAIINHQLTILQQCHQVYVRTFGLYSKEAATILYNIGRAFFCADQFDNAIKAFDHCLQIRRNEVNISGSNIENKKNGNLMDIAICMYCLGQVYHRMGKYNVAMESYQQFLDLHRMNNTIYHPEVAKTILHMADINTWEGNSCEAIALYEHVIEHDSLYFRATTDKNTSHMSIAIAHAKLGDIRAKEQKYHTALTHYVKSFRTEEDLRLVQTLPTCHHQQCHPSMPMIVTMFKIADIQRKLKLHCSAVQMYMRLYGIHVSTHGPYSLEVGRILSYIGSTLYDDQKYTLALEFFLDTFKVQMIYHCYRDTVEAATTLNSIGLIYFLRQQYASAELCFTESLRMNIKILGYDHYDNSILWYNIASTNYEQGFHEKAIKFYEAAIRIEALQSSSCSDNFAASATDDTAIDDGQRKVGRSQRRANNTRSLQKLGSIYEKQAELQMAKESYLQALHIELSVQCQQNIPTIARLLNVVGNIFLQEADIKPMMACYTTAARLLQHHKLSSERSSDGMDTVQTGRNNTNDCALIITGYKYYYLSRMHPPAAATA